MRCRLCDSNRLLSILDLGATPPCETFLTADELDLPESTFPLHLRLCEDCLLLQIPALITPEDTFTEYAYFSSYSDSFVQHAKSFVDDTAARLGLDAESFVIEVASNDGYLLQHVVAAGIPCLGIEPSVNVGAAARKRGVPTETAFLDEQLAAAVRDRHGPADLVVANNVYAHIPDLLGFTRSLRGLLAEDGWLSIEVHHALNLVTLGQFDSIYHEHFQYYTVLSAIRALATAGLALVDVELNRSARGVNMRASVRRVVVLLSVFMSSFAVSQSTTSLRGVVTDAKGAVLPGATVTIHDSQTGFSRTVNSGDDGVYQFLQLPPATYGIIVRARGFGGLTRENVTLLVSSPATLNFTM